MLRMCNSLQMVDESGDDANIERTGEESSVHGNGPGHDLMRGDSVLTLTT